ncbi:MAG: hypothetical protein ACKVOK_14755 [Flavobacteriales bacterium]
MNRKDTFNQTEAPFLLLSYYGFFTMGRMEQLFPDTIDPRYAGRFLALSQNPGTILKNAIV